MTELASLVVFTSDVKAMIAFYRAVGIGLEAEEHGDGPVHAATELSGIHVVVLPAEET